MKRPDVRLAWREKLAIFWLIILMNGIVIFYIVEFGRLLCPNFDKAWSIEEVNQHQGDNDFWVTVQGIVYDVSDFVRGDHGRNSLPSNSPDALEQLAGQDLTYYFPPPLVLACQDLVVDDTLSITPQNFSMFVPTAMHVSGRLQTQQGTLLTNGDWYTQSFLAKMKDFRKGPLVWDRKRVEALAADEEVKKSVHICRIFHGHVLTSRLSVEYGLYMKIASMT